MWDEHIGHLEKKIALVSEALLALGLELAEDKTQVIASQYYKGPRTLQIGGERVDILPAKEQIRVVGVNFSFYDGTGQQATDLLARARAAAHYHQDLLMEQGPWDDKARLLQTLVFGTLSWCAGAVHWNQEDLAMANSLQCTTLRKAFNMKRKPGETRVVWNQRTCRHVRAWLHSQQKKRWSSLILELQFGLYGHWGRQSEGCDVNGERLPGNPMRMLRWRSQKWWRHQQHLSRSTGMRHQGCFYADSTERRLADNIGLEWEDRTKDRDAWRALCQCWLERLDVTWARGRQAAVKW